MTLKLNGSTSGYVTIDAPAVAGTTALTLPATSGTLMVSGSSGAVVNLGAFYVNSQTVSVSYSIPAGSSAMSVGPVSVASGVTITIPSGSKWAVL